MEAATILVVDDEVGMREGCRRTLEPQGLRVVTAEHGAEGLHKLRQQQFDLILLDAMMPGMSGLELLERIHEHDPSIVCIMITGYATVDLAAHATKQGAQDFLPKPFTTDELLAVVERGLQERKRRQSQKRQEEQAEEAQQLERARQEMAKLDAIQSRFMLVIAHELRNPAGVIKNCLQLMRAGYVDEDEQDEYLETLDLRATQLLEMLDDILELASLKERLNLTKLKPVLLADVLEKVAGQVQPAAENKGLGFSVQIEARPTLLAQPAHFQSLWTHLLGNAICYTPKGEVTVALEEKDGLVTTTVTDTGIGISADELGQIFQEFYRADSAVAQAPLGTGLGLSIVNQIVKIYQGTIQIDSSPGQGSTFSVTFPSIDTEHKDRGV